MATAEIQHTAGANTNINRTMTPEKYTENSPNKTKKREASVSGLKRETIPAGMNNIKTLISVK